MFERFNPVFKGLCLILAMFILYQLARLMSHKSPLDQLHIPAILTTPATTNKPASTNKTVTVATATNAVKSSSTTNATNALKASTSTNVATGVQPTNAAVTVASTNSSITPLATAKPTMPLPPAEALISSLPMPSSGPSEAIGLSIRIPSGRGARRMPPGMDMMNMPPGPGGMAMPMGMPMGMPFGGPPGKATRPPDVPTEVWSRIEKIIQSEIFGPIPRPMPMGLLGIGGKDAFIRAPNGQTGLVRVGEEFGGLKLLRIGVNRVLVEQEGQQKELTMFEGFGGESLMPKGKEK